MVRILETYWVKLYLSGPIEIAKQIIRKDCSEEGLCVTIEPTTFIYTGGEESGYVVGLINYPRFPWTQDRVTLRAESLLAKLLSGTFQKSGLLQTPSYTKWYSIEQD